MPGKPGGQFQPLRSGDVRKVGFGQAVYDGDRVGELLGIRGGYLDRRLNG